MNLFNLFAKLVLNDKEYKEKLEKDKKEAESFGSKVGTAFKAGAKVVTAFAGAVSIASSALIAIGKISLDMTGEIDDNAQRLSMTTDEYQLWANTMLKAGADASTLQTSIRYLTEFTNKLAEGNGDALLTLEKLGIGYEDFIDLSVSDQMKLVTESLQGMEDQTERTRIAQEIFGNRAYQMLLPLFNEEKGSLDALWKAFYDMGIIISEDTVKAGADLGDKFNYLIATGKSLVASFGEEMYPALTLIIDGLQGLANGSDDASTKLSEGLLTIVDKVNESLPQLLDTVVNLLKNLIEGTIPFLPELAKILVNVIELLILTLLDLLPDLIGAVLEIILAIVDGLTNLDWGTILVKLLNAIFKIVGEKVPQFVEGIFDQIANILPKLIDLLFTEEGWKKIGKIGGKLGEALINGFISAIESGINFVISAINVLLKGIDKVLEVVGVNANLEISKVSLPRVSFFAEGGMLDKLTKGTMYAVAGESGAEIVAQGRHGTGVANVEQIAEAQAIGLKKFGLEDLIHNAVSAIVNGIVSGLKQGNSSQSQNSPVIVKIGDKEFRGWIVGLLNNILKSEGRQTLSEVTAYK